ncbi:MAG TPA: fructosamine kinase family protein [Dongiaceae bacterium]|nr:fructosamine kinase family protein [Allosphingosinicella sp.]HKP27066.1 fructosamine kinase family protein [Dongiaceae bacterium]HKS18104.1 fructosamine kinase family protein [Bradyrhizobium sp.]
MSAFARKVAALADVREERIERLAGGDLSEVLLVHRADGRAMVAKGGPAIATEASMLRALLAAGAPTPLVEAEHDGVLFIEHVPNDGIFSPAAWRDIGTKLRQLHDGTAEQYGWPVDYRLGTVELDNRRSGDWPAFWGVQRLAATAAVLDRPWRERIDPLVARLPGLLPAAPRPSHLHGDLWTGNILVAEGKLAALIDPACYHGDAEVDLAMLHLFGEPPDTFIEAYGPLAAGWEKRRPVYQLFPALVHLRLFGAAYAAMVDRLLTGIGF